MTEGVFLLLLCQRFQGTQADIAALVQLFKADLLGCFVGVAQGVGQARAGGGNAQHAAAVGHQLAVLGNGSAGMVHRHVLLAGQLTVHKAGDGLALLD